MLIFASLNASNGFPCRLELVLRGVLAGNIFDLGAAGSAALFDRDGAAASFASTRDKLLARPWVVDDLDVCVQHLSTVSLL